MIIEKYHKSHDINAILKIDLEAVEDFYDRIKDKYSQEELKNIDRIQKEGIGEYFIGSIDNKITAICGYKIVDNETVELRRFRVKKILRSKGIGSELLLYVEEKIKEHNFTKIILETANIRKSTLKFYTNKGYTKIGEGTYGEIKTIQFQKLI